jgi:hypothetical protein
VRNANLASWDGYYWIELHGSVAIKYRFRSSTVLSMFVFLRE